MAVNDLIGKRRAMLEQILTQVISLIPKDHSLSKLLLNQQKRAMYDQMRAKSQKRAKMYDADVVE